jgi:uncharacterized membrane protein
MSTQNLVSSAAACAMALGLIGSVAAHEQKPGTEKCYGIAKAGQNDCANLAGTYFHSSMALARLAMPAQPCVPAGTCKKLKGLSEDEAEAKFKAAATKK